MGADPPLGPIEKRKTLRRLGKLIDPVIDLGPSLVRRSETSWRHEIDLELYLPLSVELEAYASVVTAFRAQGPLTE